VTDLPFCALVLREWKNPVTPGFDDYVIMEGDRMTEDNLRLLFKVLSDQHSDEPNFQSWVYTDATQLASIATQSVRSGELDEMKNHKWAHYLRSPEREYFEFKPIASAKELSKVILREQH